MFSAFCALLEKEIEEIDRTVEICRIRLARRHEFSSNDAEDILADSLSACLHSFYSGLENLLQAIALEVDEGLPKGARWHKQLLQQMATSIPKVRGPVLSDLSSNHLEEFLAFRHLFRNLYTHKINPERIFMLGDKLHVSWQSVRNDLNAFIQFLRQTDAA